MNLFDMKPAESKLKLKAFKRELTLNPITLSDEAWLADNYSQEQIQEIFEQINLKEISRIVFRLLTNEDKMLFASQEVRFVSEDGESIEKNIGGVELFRQAIIGPAEKLAVLNALLENIGASRPEPKKKVVKKATKKKVKKKK